jgi:PAS domain-containing protein
MAAERNKDDRQRIGRAIRKSEERFRVVVESAPNAIVMIGPTGLIEMVNTQTERVFGYSRNELLGQPIEMLVRGAIVTTIRDCEPRSLRIPNQGRWEQDATSTA